jgi:membrane protease YdiL (CAAX protease family)
LFFASDFIYNFYFIIGHYDLPVSQEASSPSIIKMVNSIILTPLMEEVFFRGILLALVIKYSEKQVAAVILVSVLYAVDHLNYYHILDSLPHAFVMFFTGMISGYIFLKTKNIIFPVMFHIFYNFNAYLLDVFREEYSNIIKALDFDMNYWLLVTMALLLLVYVLKSFATKIE